MNIKIMGKMNAIQHTYLSKIPTCVIVSINSLKEKIEQKPPFDLKNPQVKAILYTYFEDLRPEQVTCNKNHRLMNQSDVENILGFVDIWKDSVEEIIIHCHAGVSRSSAVAAGISRYLREDDYWIWTDGSYRPNTHVFETMCSIVQMSREDLEQRYRLNREAQDKLEYEEVILLAELDNKKAMGCSLCNVDHPDYSNTTYITYLNKEDGYVLCDYDWKDEYDRVVLSNLKCCPICRRDLLEEVHEEN